jgi:hypothetical protein
MRHGLRISEEDEEIKNMHTRLCSTVAKSGETVQQ